MDFSETIVVYGIKVGRCSQLNEYMKICEYQRSRSFNDFGPNHSDSIFLNFFSSATLILTYPQHSDERYRTNGSLVLSDGISICFYTIYVERNTIIMPMAKQNLSAIECGALKEGASVKSFATVSLVSDCRFGVSPVTILIPPRLRSCVEACSLLKTLLSGDKKASFGRHVVKFARNWCCLHIVWRFADMWNRIAS